MVKTFATNADNDLYIGADGNLAIATGLDAVMGACASAAKALLGEMVLEVNKGIPYFQSVFNGIPNLAIFQSYLLNALNAVPGVNSVKNLTVSVSNHTLNYTAEIDTIYGLGKITNG